MVTRTLKLVLTRDMLLERIIKSIFTPFWRTFLVCAQWKLGICKHYEFLTKTLFNLRCNVYFLPFCSGKGNGPYADTSKLTVRGKTAQKNSRFNHLRLLSPGTRKERWMHTTWHHLPEYRNDDVVENWSSHYIRPHAVIPRHFVIHPDWG